MSVVEERVRAGGLLAGPVVVLLSGGRDSVCLLDLAVRLAGPVTALHVNYGLREEADVDEEHCAALAERLGAAFEVRRAGPPSGNVQAWAREVRYREAARLGPVVATGHTATDQVETVLYRLAASPGRRALLGIRDRPGVIRPLLGCTREETAAHCVERGLPWREDPTNESGVYARNRVRNELLPALRAVHPAAEANVLRTLEILRDEAEVLDSLIDLDPSVERIKALPPALRRLTVQAIAGGPAVASRADEILALGPQGTSTLDLGGGLRAVVEYGRLRFDHGPPAPPDPARLHVPGSVAFGAGCVSCEPADDGALRCRGARYRARGPCLAAGGPHADPHAPGSLHRPQDPARASGAVAGGGLGGRDRLGAGRRHRRALRRRPRHAAARPAHLGRIDCAPHAPGRAHRGDPRAGG